MEKKIYRERLIDRYNSVTSAKILTFQPVVGDRSRMDHSKALGLLIQKSDHTSGYEWSFSGLKWSRVVQSGLDQSFEQKKP